MHRFQCLYKTILVIDRHGSEIFRPLLDDPDQIMAPTGANSAWNLKNVMSEVASRHVSVKEKQITCCVDFNIKTIAYRRRKILQTLEIS